MEAVTSRAKRMIRGWGAIFGIPALFIVAYIYGAIPSLGKLPLCGARYFLGFDCPGCGMTRAISALTHLNFRSSIDYHPLGIFVAVWLLYVFFRHIFWMISGRYPKELMSQRGRDILVYSFLFFLILSWLIKIAIMSLC